MLTVATSATSVVALTSSHARARLVRIALALSVLTVVLAAVGAASGNHDWLNLATLIQVSLLTLAMGAVLRRVVMAPEVGSRTILGALSVYAVLGILFTFLYGVIDRVQGGPFFEGHAQPGELRLPLLQLHDADHDRLRQPRSRRSARPPDLGPGDDDRARSSSSPSSPAWSASGARARRFGGGASGEAAMSRQQTLRRSPEAGYSESSTRSIVCASSRAVGGVGLGRLDRVDHVHALDDLAEDRVLAVEPGRRLRW